MVSASFIVSALFALTVAVSAAPSLIGQGAHIDSGDHLGTGQIDLNNLANGILEIEDAEIHENLQRPHVLA